MGPGTSHAVFFDLDGVLVDSVGLIGECADVAFREAGLAGLTISERIAIVGPPLVDGIADVLRGRGADPGLAAAIVARYRAVYDPIAVTRTPAHAGMPELVAALAARRRLAVVTSKPELLAGAIVDHLGWSACFAVVVGGPPSGSEPKALAVRRALDSLGVAPSTVTMVGDRHHDVEAAHAHGIFTVGVTWGAGSRAELEAAGAGLVVDDVETLAAALGAGDEVLAG